MAIGYTFWIHKYVLAIRVNLIRTNNFQISEIKNYFSVLQEHNVRLENIILLTLFATPHGIRAINNAFPKIRISTSEVHQVAPTHFCQKYFGTD